jgi:glycerophosphoinositol glycerophosphodiesterase
LFHHYILYRFKSILLFKAKKNGADAIEFDVDYTKEGTPIVIHDDTVDRTTDGVGRVSQMTFDTIRTLSASAKHPRR